MDKQHTLTVEMEKLREWAGGELFVRGYLERFKAEAEKAGDEKIRSWLMEMDVLYNMIGERKDTEILETWAALDGMGNIFAHLQTLRALDGMRMKSWE
jgi:hypothetical protein